MEKIVFFDFQGVLDKKNSFDNFNSNLIFQIKEQTDVDKAYRLFKFISDENAFFASISSMGLSSCIIDGIMVALINSPNETHRIFADEFSFSEQFLSNMYFFDRNDLIKNDLLNSEDLSDFKVVVFEDEAFFEQKYNPIYINPSIGLTNDDINKAHTIFQE